MSILVLQPNNLIVESDQKLEQSLRDLAETLAPMESPEAIRDIVERTRALQLDIRARTSIYANDIAPLASLAHAISKLPSTDIWQKVKKTNDLEVFFYQSQWIYERISEIFFNTALILNSRNQLRSSTARSPEEKEIFQRLTDQENLFGEGAYVRAERKFSKTASKSNLTLIHRVAEKLFREWEIINHIFPELIKTKTLSSHPFDSPASLLLQILKREAEKPIIQRVQSYFDFNPSQEKRFWQSLRRAYQKKITDDQLQRLYRDLNRKKNALREAVILTAINLSENDDQLLKKLIRLDEAIEDLVDEGIKDLERRGSRGYKYSQEIWKNGERYKFDNNQLIRDPYSQEPDDIVIIDLRDGVIKSLKRSHS